MTNSTDSSREITEDAESVTGSAPVQTSLDRKVNRLFPGVVVRKDLVNAVKGNAVVPSFVLEYLLGQYAASDDEDTIDAGIDAVRNILADHYVHRNQAELVKSTIRERGRHRIIDRVTATLNEKDDVYQAEFSNLGIKGVLVAPATIKAHPKLLVGGVWCICDIEYFHDADARQVPWVLGSIKPIQLSKFDFDAYLAARTEFTTDEWIDLLIQSIGLNPDLFDRRAKLLQLVRLVPFVERNYNLIELGPKGTGKSHIFSEFSPHGMLISGGEVTVPKLFVNNANGRLGLVGYWDVVAFDEFAGKQKRSDRALVDILKNYMANKTFSRGVETISAEASMVFVGNTSHTVPHMLKHSDLFDELPESYHDSAFLDRLHHYVPGWEIETIRGEMFSDGYGFVVDYIAEVLKSMRSADSSDAYQQHFTLSSDISTRDRDGIHKTFSGLMKIVYPHGEATVDEINEILRFSIEGRKRVKDQILRMDATMEDVEFGYSDSAGTWHAVATLEEGAYPSYYHKRAGAPGDLTGDSASGGFREDPLPKPDLVEVETANDTTAREYAIGETFSGRFEIRDVLGIGGFSTVYRVFDVVEQEERALKVFENAAGYDAVRREIGALRKVQHPNVVKVFWAGRAESGEWWLVTEFVDGEVLEEYSSGSKHLRDREAVDVAIDVLDALIAIHPDAARIEELNEKNREGAISGDEFDELLRIQDEGLVHRDVKPQNVILTRTGAKLLDFNITSRVGAEVSTLAGTPPYQPPDPSYTRWDVSTDLFAAGVLLYELLTDGQHPYPGRTPTLGEDVIDPRVARPELPAPLAGFVIKACAPERQDRFSTAQEMKASLVAVRDEA